MEVDALNNEQWARIEPFVPGGRKGRRGPRTNNRRFVDALVWMARSGGRWRDLPERYGNYQTTKRRYYRWIEMGVFDRLFEAIAREPDLEWLAIDATVIRAQAQAAGARRKRMARPGCKRQLDDGLNGLHKRIRHVSALAAAKMEIRASQSS